MQKLKEHYRRVFQTAHLSLEDLEAIVTILKEQGRVLRIESNGYLYDSIEEIAKSQRHQIKHLNITTCRQDFNATWFSFSFESFNAVPPFSPSFALSCDSKEAGAGEIFKISEIVNKKRSVLARCFPGWLTVPAFILLVGASGGRVRHPSLISLVILLLVIIFVSFSFQNGNFSSIILKKQSPIFNEEAKRNILVGVIGAVIYKFIEMGIGYFWNTLH
jgi:hypothetical protein